MGATSATTAWGYPTSRPFILLFTYFMIGALQVSILAARVPVADTNVEALAAIAACAVGLALAVLVVWVRRMESALPTLVALGILLSALSATVAVSGQGQLVAGLYLAVLGVYAGYFLSARMVRLMAALSTVAFGMALVFNWRLDSLAYLIAVVLVVDGVTLLVSSLVEHLRRLVVRDPLTGALNRRGLQDSAIVVRNLDDRRQSVTSVVAIDLDDFKQFNDMHGHLAGDDLLTSLVQDWAAVLRRTDILARVGGDEFVLISPDTTSVEAEDLITRMRAVNEFPWSAGIVTWNTGESLPSVTRRADEAMYRLKASRRDNPAS